MADDYVQVQPDSGGKRLQTYTNTVGGFEVHSEAVTLTSSAGVPNKIIDDKLRVSSMPYLYDIAEGNVSGHIGFSKLGYNTDIDNQEEDVWTQGGKYVFPTGAMGMEVYAASANDDLTGSGIQKVKVYYLDNTYAAQVEEVELQGGLAAPMTANNILRVNAVRASQVGASKMAEGLITVRHINDTPVYRAIAQGYTRGRGLIYTVPLGKTLYITDINISCSSIAGGHYARFTLRTNYDEVTNALVGWMVAQFEMSIQDGGLHIPFQIPLKIPATADVVMSVISDAVNADVVASASLRGWTE